MKKNNPSAFTLAETLITLGIIGIVTAMILPAVIHGYRKKQVESKLKSTYVILNELFLHSQLDNGKIDSWPLNKNTAQAQQYFYEKYIFPYINGEKQCTKNATTRICSMTLYSSDGKKILDKEGFITRFDSSYKFILPNNVGAFIRQPTYTFSTSQDGIRIEIHIDLNISPDKMRSGIDYFQIAALKSVQHDFTYLGAVKPYTSRHKGIYLPSCDVIANSDFVMSDGTRLNAKDLCVNNIDDRYGYGNIFCAALIQCNAWKIPNNYPVKL